MARPPHLRVNTASTTHWRSPLSTPTSSSCTRLPLRASRTLLLLAGRTHTRGNGIPRPHRYADTALTCARYRGEDGERARRARIPAALPHPRPLPHRIHDLRRHWSALWSNNSEPPDAEALVCRRLDAAGIRTAPSPAACPSSPRCHLGPPVPPHPRRLSPPVCAAALEHQAERPAACWTASVVCSIALWSKSSHGPHVQQEHAAPLAVVAAMPGIGLPPARAASLDRC